MDGYFASHVLDKPYSAMGSQDRYKKVEKELEDYRQERYDNRKLTVFGSFLSNKAAVFGGIVILIFILMAILAPYIAPYSYDEMDFTQHAPSAQLAESLWHR